MAILLAFILNFETGPLWTGYNDVRIPGDTGTLFSLKDDLRSDTEIYYRLRGGLIVGGNHTFFRLWRFFLGIFFGPKKPNFTKKGEI
jgi:hypothetical protein